MKVSNKLPLALIPLYFVTLVLATAQPSEPRSPAELLAGAVQKLVSIIEPASDAKPATFAARVELVKADGLPKDVVGQSARVAFQAPDRAIVSVTYKNESYSIGRDGQELWAHVTGKKFGVIGKAGQPLYLSNPDKKDATKLSPVRLPLPREQLALLPLLMNVEARREEKVGGIACHVLRVTPKPEATQVLKIPQSTIHLWLRQSDLLPLRISYADGAKLDLTVELADIRFDEPWLANKWKIPAKEGDKIETTALGHLTRFVPVALGMLTAPKIPVLGPATGERTVVATEGKGRFEMIDGTRVLYLEGTPQEMGAQHGALLRREIKQLVNRIVYGVGVGSSFGKGRWFFGEIEEAQRRLAPFIDMRYLAEMDAIALASGHDREEIRLANFFPELFHCSGFAIFGNATQGGTLYHGRILDYLRGMGLEQNAVVIVSKPDQGHAWVNVSYSGFVGSVTAMNEKKVAIGEMGGRGEGNWDGKPMAQLIREVMEKASTLEEAVDIMRKSPRTCEYYYVISDGKSRRAVGIAATPEKFETVWPGQPHERLPHPVKDAVLLSAGERYDKLVEWVKAGYRRFDADSARDLMKRPVCMPSNIHSVLFAPETLDFWVANADSDSPASHTRFTKYNLADLLKPRPVE
jgi:isopenicillin-N N-acyltransferase-like protein